jgi:hypothetical protein
MKAEAKRAREMAREETMKLREEEDRINWEKFECEGKREEVVRVIVVEREEVEGLREEREVLEFEAEEAWEDEEVQ